MRLPQWLDPPGATEERVRARRLPEWLDPPTASKEVRPAESSKGSAVKSAGAGLNVGPAVGTFIVVVGLAIFPIAALLLCIGILALVHAVF